jgi:predicted RNase H-like HicB family nuclease
MLTYKAMFKFLEDQVHAEILDFPGVITSASTLAEARRLLSSALVDMADIALQQGEALPLPNPRLSDSNADLEEPIYLLLESASVVTPTASVYETT